MEFLNEDYQDADETQASRIKIRRDNEMSMLRYKHKAYETASVLLLSWHRDFEDLETDEEVTNLERLFQEKYRYTTTRAELKPDSQNSAQLQLNKHLSDFVYDHDGPNALLIIYYAGHGRPGQIPGGLHLAGSNSMPSSESEVHEVVWNSTETIIKETHGDVLVIFDCCYAGKLERNVRAPLSHRVFEFLAATSAKSTTPKPGPRSFTSALIYTLSLFAKDRSPFSTQELVHMIQSAPCFPENQCPRLHKKHPSRSRIILAELSPEYIMHGRKFRQSNDDEKYSTGSESSRSAYDKYSSNAGDYTRAASTLPSSALESNMKDKNLNLDSIHAESFSMVDPTGSDDDTATVYSFTTDGSVETGEEKYEAYFGLELFKRISSLRPEEEDMCSLAHSLPKLLQSFTRRLGSENSAQIYRDIMRYIHKHRAPITRHFENNVLLAHRDDDDSDEMRRPIGAEMTSPTDLVSNWLNGEEPNQGHGSPSDDELFEGVGDIEYGDHDLSPELSEFRRVVETSSAYSWLLKKLEHELLYAVSGESHIDKIAKAVFSHDAFRYVTRKSPPLRCNVEYLVDWNPLDFIYSQRYQEIPSVVVANALTLTGSPTQSEALICSDYIKRTWPQSGAHFLSLLQSLLATERETQCSSILNDGTTIRAYMRNTDCVFEVYGQPDTVVDIGEQIIRVARETDLIGSTISLALELGAEITEEKIAVSDEGCCWRDLFRDPLLVQGYPIAKRPEHVPGSEMSLTTMMMLIGARRITPFKRNLFIKGHSKMLVATKEANGIVLWHVIANENGQYIYYHDKRVGKNVPEWRHDPKASELIGKRHIVGWWSEIRNVAGTSSGNLSILGSGLPSPGFGFAFDRVTVGGGKYITMNVPIALGRRDKPAKSQRGGFYHDQVREALIQYVVFYDTNEHRAWLLDGATALLHLARASLVADDKNGFPLLHKHDEIREEGKDTETSAPEDEDRKRESKHPANDLDPVKTEVIVTHKATYYRFSDRVSELYSVLEDIFNHQSDMAPDGVGFKVSMSPLQQLEGFDFKDIAGGSKTVHPKSVRLGRRGMGWVDLLRGLHAITLFGRGFGEILQAKAKESDTDAQLSLCADWVRVPSNRHYLAVSNTTLRRILEDHGQQDQTPRLLASQLYWHCPDKYCEGCAAKNDSRTATQDCHCDRVQVILPKTFFNSRLFQTPQEIPSQGGTIFGHSRKYPVRWITSHNATEGDPGPDEQIPTTTNLEENLGSSSTVTIDQTIASSRSPSPGLSTSITTAASRWSKMRKSAQFFKRSEGEGDGPRDMPIHSVNGSRGR
ncbi:hypothetical protein G7054_g12877 [Neopestalotiopsis clavispora]|nr:hypothetical protein G7054_g12877 [Neopestalotiopsis clavispora]